MLVPLVLSFLCPCLSLANYFWKPLIQFLSSDPLINSLYSRNVSGRVIKDCIGFEKRIDGWIGSAAVLNCQ